MKKLFENVDGNRFKIISETKELSPKSIGVIQKWQSEAGGDNRKVSVKLIDYVLSKKLGGLTSADLPDTSTFANGLDGITDALESGDYNGALDIALETAKAMIEEEGGEGIMENNGQENPRDALYVEYIGPYGQEKPFTLKTPNGQEKFEYCKGKYPDGKRDIAVYAYRGDLCYGYNAFKKMHNLP